MENGTKRNVLTEQRNKTKRLNGTKQRHNGTNNVLTEQNEINGTKRDRKENRQKSSSPTNINSTTSSNFNTLTLTTS